MGDGDQQQQHSHLDLMRESEEREKNGVFLFLGKATLAKRCPVKGALPIHGRPSNIFCPLGLHNCPS